MKRRTRSVSKTKKHSSSSYEISGVIILFLGVFAALSLWGMGTGLLGDLTNQGIHFLFGIAAWPFAAFLMYFGARYAIFSKGPEINRRNFLVGFLIVLLLTFVHHYYVPTGQEFNIERILKYGGIIGAGISALFHVILGNIGTTLILIVLLIIDILLLTHWSLSEGAKKAGTKARNIGQRTGNKIGGVAQKLKDKRKALEEARSAARLETLNDKPTEFIYKKKAEPSVDELLHYTVETDESVIETPDIERHEADSGIPVDLDNSIQENNETDSPVEGEREDPDSLEETEEIDEIPMLISDVKDENQPTAFEREAEGKDKETEPLEEKASDSDSPVPEYQFPPLSLLHAGPGKSTGPQDIDQKGALIEFTLNSYGVKAKVLHASVGPTVTRFELRPEVGVRVKQIENLQNELAMALAATHIRIEAPIPGKSAVGIEIPNSKSSAVPLRDVLDSDEFRHGKGHILVALGKDIAGKPVVTDLSKMPHLLIAGSTGSGKSVCINSIITSIIYHSRPDEVKLMLIDPKVVELSVYNGIPHLRTEVITNMKKAEGALNWAVKEMEARYQLLAGARVRNIEGYNKLYPDKKLPYILIIVDEFADLMNVAAKDVEVLIQRLTQKARAAGIHLILATQRPSANVITGVIKSNIPSRIAFMVESSLNSRIILDENGAESLLGKGDMLFKEGGALTVRVQGAFISDEEVESVVEFVKNECLKQEQIPVRYDPIDLSVPEKDNASEATEEESEELPDEVVEWVLDTKRASVSALQRRFRIGYTKAGRFMDIMEKMGIVGPANGAKPREILMAKEQALALLSDRNKKGGNDNISDSEA